MIEKHLASIRSGEDQARSRIAEAEDEALEIVERAREEGERSLEDVLVKAAEEERSLLAAAGRKAEEEVTSIRTAEAKRIPMRESSHAARAAGPGRRDDRR